MTRRFRDRRRRKATIKLDLLSLEGRNPVTPIGAGAVIALGMTGNACVRDGGGGVKGL